MPSRRAIVAVSLGLSALTVGLVAAPAQAAINPTAEASATCGKTGGMIEVNIGDGVLIEIGVVGWNLPAGQYFLGPFLDGEYTVLFKLTEEGDPFATDEITIDCEPEVAVRAVCESPIEGIGVAITENPNSADNSYSVSLNGTFVAEGTDGGAEVVYGPVADGDYLVEVFWAAGDDEEDPFFSELVTKDCAAAGSGGSLPDAGAASRALTLMAGLLVAIGAAAMLLRRPRRA